MAAVILMMMRGMSPALLLLMLHNPAVVVHGRDAPLTVHMMMAAPGSLLLHLLLMHLLLHLLLLFVLLLLHLVLLFLVMIGVLIRAAQLGAQIRLRIRHTDRSDQIRRVLIRLLC